MGIYDPIENHLRNLTGDRWVVSFSEIESILGRSLPASARKHEPWWSNSHADGRHNSAWLDAGWMCTDLSLSRQCVTFRKAAKDQTHKVPRLERNVRPDPEDTRRIVCDWDEANKGRVSLSWTWQPLGTVRLDASQRLLFPKASVGPAIYRLRIRRDNKEARYVGEAENLSRRFGNYRNPGPTQQTSLRINSILKAALADNAEIAVACIQAAASIVGLTGESPADLSSKVVRCLFENAVLCVEHGDEIESLNRAKL